MKILIISGPTATGKTKLALHLAKVFGGELISADSRQVYKYMDVVTGKDIPSSFNIQYSEFRINNNVTPFYTDGQTKLWGYDIVFPNQQWSAAHFVKFARHIIPEIYQRRKLPIVAGGTGLYIKNLLHPPATLFIPPDPKLRRQLEKLTPAQLQNKLRRLNPKRFSQMNYSDRHNPRRLIRATEVEKLAKPLTSNEGFASFNADVLHVCLTVKSNHELYRRIDRRVEDRLGEKLNQELEFLKQKNFLRFAPSQTIGYNRLIEYLDGKITFGQAVQKWKFAEHKYARNQLTWFKKQPDIHWFDIAAPGFPDDVVSRVKQWYHY